MEYDIIVIGGGIVGLASALRILEQRPQTRLCLIEKENQIARHQTGNNSGVIHSGIYYKPGSLKALNCLRGYNMLVDFCTRENVPFEICGKLIVATSSAELPLLDNIYKRGQQNGLTDLRMLSREEIREFEPYSAGIAAIRVPQTGIVDYAAVAQRYAELITAKGGTIVLGEKVININNYHNSSEVITTQKTYLTQLVINCAGLYADKIAAINRDNIEFRIIPFRGEYYKLRDDKQYLVKNLIYPVPDPNFPFLGVHFTRMIGGGVEAGPNAVLAFKREGYQRSDFHSRDFLETITWKGFQKVALKYWRTGLGEFYRSYSKAAFTKALQRLLPDIREEDLVPGGAGIRAQACDKNGGLIDDFLILEDRYIINVCNAPSPAATSSLSIGQSISEMALKRFN